MLPDSNKPKPLTRTSSWAVYLPSSLPCSWQHRSKLVGLLKMLTVMRMLIQYQALTGWAGMLLLLFYGVLQSPLNILIATIGYCCPTRSVDVRDISLLIFNRPYVSGHSVVSEQEVHNSRLAFGLTLGAHRASSKTCSAGRAWRKLYTNGWQCHWSLNSLYYTQHPWPLRDRAGAATRRLVLNLPRP